MQTHPSTESLINLFLPMLPPPAHLSISSFLKSQYNILIDFRGDEKYLPDNWCWSVESTQATKDIPHYIILETTGP